MSEEKKTIAEQVLELWERDSVVDRHNVGEESAKIPKLHSKYIKYLLQVKGNLIKLRKRKGQLYRDKRLYYTGKADDALYKKDNFHLKVNSSDADVFIKGDDEYLNVIAKIEEYEGVEETLKSILGMIKDRQWHLRNILEHDRFVSGG